MIRTYPACDPLPNTPEDDRRAWYGEPPKCRALVHWWDVWTLGAVLHNGRAHLTFWSAYGWRRYSPCLTQAEHMWRIVGEIPF